MTQELILRHERAMMLAHGARSAAGEDIDPKPVVKPLDEAALAEAQLVDLGGSPALKARVLSPKHVVAKAIQVGRLKDLARVEAFLDQNTVDLEKLRSLLERFDLMPGWSAFCLKAGRNNPFLVGS